MSQSKKYREVYELYQLCSNGKGNNERKRQKWCIYFIAGFAVKERDLLGFSGNNLFLCKKKYYSYGNNNVLS